MRRVENFRLPDEVYARVEETARQQNRSVADQAAEFVAIGLARETPSIRMSAAEKLRLADEVRAGS